MQLGFCQRGNLAAGPMHKNTLSDAVERLSAEELEYLLNETARRLAERGFFRQSKGHFALDATDLETTPQCQGAGLKKYSEWKVNKDKQAVEVERFAYGFDVEHVKGANSKGFVGNALNAVVVTKWQGEEYEAGKEKVFLTSLPIAKPLEVLDLYDLRSLIENTAFRELKQGWYLTKYPKKTEGAIRAHVFLTLVTFTLANAFRTELGQELAGRGVRRQRAEEESGAVIVFADEHYAIFDIEEVFILLGVVPRHCLRVDPAKVRRRYGLQSVV